MPLLTAHGDDNYFRVWKGVDWDAMNLLFEKGWIDDPKSRNKSVALSLEGRIAAQRFYEKHLKKRSWRMPYNKRVESERGPRS